MVFAVAMESMTLLEHLRRHSLPTHFLQLIVFDESS